MLTSAAQARTKLPSRFSQFRRRRFTGCSCTFSDMNFMLHGRCKESVTYGGQNRTHCENRGRRSISWTLPKR